MHRLLSEIKRLKKNQKAIVAFNVQNIYQLEALDRLSIMEDITAIAQFSQSYIDFFDYKYSFGRIIEKSSDKLFFHLDHCSDINRIVQCLKLGFDSVMYDGSSMPLSLNIEETNKIHQITQEYGALLEVEIGAIKGREDGFGSNQNDYFSVKDFEEFRDSASYELIALSIGNAHGYYEDESNVKPELLKEVFIKYPDIMHVLHGGTGLAENTIKETIRYGTVKINISTELKRKSQQILFKFVTENMLLDEKKLESLYMQELVPFYFDYIKKYSL